MKTIEINTSFNVIIKFNLATVFDRGVAYLIDMAVVWASIGLLTIFINALSTSTSQYLFLYAAVPIFGFYTLISEIVNNGQTIGKMAMKLQVVRIDGQRTKTSDYFMRWIFRLIDLYFSGFILAILTASASKRGQRLGDILADTTVIKTKEFDNTTLISLTRLDDLKKHEPKYPEVTKLTEAEMMIIKECLERERDYPNEAHQHALNKLVSKLEELLQLKCKTDKKTFLKNLIKDYVALTR